MADELTQQEQQRLKDMPIREYIQMRYGPKLLQCQQVTEELERQVNETVRWIRTMKETAEQARKAGLDTLDFLVIHDLAELWFIESIDYEKVDPSQSMIAVLAASKEEIQLLFSEMCAFARDCKAKPSTDAGGFLRAFTEQRETREAAEIIVDGLAPIQSLIPKYHTMPNNALMNVLQQKPAINAGAFDLPVSNERGRRKEITAYTMIAYEPDETDVAITPINLSEYERQVSDAVISLWVEAQKQDIPAAFTTDTIYRAMPGGGDKPSPQQRGAITKAMEKFRRLHIYVDATEEMRRRKCIGENETFTIDDYYLSFTQAQRKTKTGGKQANAYILHAQPIILAYCNMTNQLLTVNTKYIEIRKVKKGKVSAEPVHMTAGRQAMTGYMLRRIAVMKRDKKNYAKARHQSNVILFDTLFAETGTTTTDRKQTGLNRDFCFDVLDYWKATGFINGHTKQTEGRKITGIIIDI